MISLTNAYKRDFKKYAAELMQSEGYIEVMHCLLNRTTLPPKYCDHALSGDWSGYRDCHIKNDLVLIYQQNDDGLLLVRLGTHAALFG